MVISRDKLVIIWASFFILATFSFNFIYNYFTVVGLIPKVNYSLISNFLSIITLIIAFTYNKALLYNKTLFNILIVFITYSLIFSLISFTFSSNLIDIGALTESLVLILYFTCFVFVFSFYYDLPSYPFKICFLIIFFIALVETDFSQIIPFSLDNIAGGSEGHINYQLTSFFTLITWFCFFFKETGALRRFIYTVLAIYLLLISGGRSELVGFIISGFFTIICFYFFSSTNKIKKTLLLLLVTSICIYSMFYLYSTYFDLFTNSRHLQIFDLEHNSSWEARQNLTEINIKQIINQPILGAYGSHRSLGDGAYIHNILSAWQQFGLLGFILFASVVYFPFILTLYYLLKDNTKYNIYPCVFISTYIVIVSTFTKPVFWPYSGIALALLIAYNKIKIRTVE